MATINEEDWLTYLPMNESDMLSVAGEPVWEAVRADFLDRMKDVIDPSKIRTEKPFVRLEIDPFAERTGGVEMRPEFQFTDRMGRSEFHIPNNQIQPVLSSMDKGEMARFMAYLFRERARQLGVLADNLNTAYLSQSDVALKQRGAPDRMEISMHLTKVTRRLLQMQENAVSLVETLATDAVKPATAPRSTLLISTDGSPLSLG